jgi:hypothetical protein
MSCKELLTVFHADGAPQNQTGAMVARSDRRFCWLLPVFIWVWSIKGPAGHAVHASVRRGVIRQRRILGRGWFDLAGGLSFSLAGHHGRSKEGRSSRTAACGWSHQRVAVEWRALSIGEQNDQL